MKGSFEDNNRQVRHLMEAIGGSANAYEEPSAPKETPAPTPTKPNPFEDPASETETITSALLAGTSGEEPTPEDEARATEETLGGTHLVLGDEEVDDMEGEPPLPLNPDYERSADVEEGGELAAIWDGFTWVDAASKPREIQMDSGPATIHRTAEGAWVLEDLEKNRKYLKEEGTLDGHLRPGKDVLIWVSGLSNFHPDLGYIHNGYAFLRK